MNGNQRAENEARQIKQTERKGWEYLPSKSHSKQDDSRPEWIVDAAWSDRLNQTTFQYNIYHGDTYVYRAEGAVHANEVHVFRKLKRDYFDTTRNEGTCPNCQAYVKRQPEDLFLTCHRCNWKVGTPLTRWLFYPSWIDYYFRD